MFDVGLADADSLTTLKAVEGRNRSLWETLPAPHREVLEQSNGFTLFNGGYRVLGVGRADVLDMRKWNDPDLWKFAWPMPLDSYFCFAMTVWGDQFAYRTDGEELVGPEVVLLDSVLMSTTEIAPSFDDFANGFLAQSATHAHDSFTRDAIAHHGAVPAGSLLAYTPSLALGGDERSENTVKLPAEVAMVFAGDIAKSLREAPSGAVPRVVAPYVDELGRQRLALEHD